MRVRVRQLVSQVFWLVVMAFFTLVTLVVVRGEELNVWLATLVPEKTLTIPVPQPSPTIREVEREKSVYEYATEKPVEDFAGVGLGSDEQSGEVIMSLYGTLVDFQVDAFTGSIELKLPDYMKESAEYKLGTALMDESKGTVAFIMNGTTLIRDPYSGGLVSVVELNPDDATAKALQGAYVVVVAHMQGDEVIAREIAISVI